jgi:hypothetical protein
MRYVKTVGVGVISAVAAAALYLLIKEAWATLYIALVLVPRAQASAVSGSWDASYPMMLDIRGPLVIGFILGCWWMTRRQRVRSTPRQ